MLKKIALNLEKLVFVQQNGISVELEGIKGGEKLFFVANEKNTLIGSDFFTVSKSKTDPIKKNDPVADEDSVRVLTGKESIDLLKSIGHFKGNKEKDISLLKTYGCCDEQKIERLIDEMNLKKHLVNN